MRKKTRYFLIIILAIMVFGVFIWLKMLDNKTDNNQIIENSKFSNVSSIDDYDIFLSITNIIDNFYFSVSNLNSNYLLDVYSNEYLVNNGLNSSNILDGINENDLNITKYLTSNYYVCNKYNCYIYGELEGLSSNYNGSYFKKLDTEFLLITIDLTNKTYNITPLTKDRELIEYANNYPKETITIEKNTNNSYENVIFDDKNMINYYLQYVKYLIIVDSNSITNYASGYSQTNAIDYLNRLGNTLYSYNKQDKQGFIEYKGTLFDGSSFTLYDYAPMNFKISFD